MVTNSLTSVSVDAPTAAQLRYLSRGLTQPGGKLPLFDEEGQAVPVDVVQTCIARGLASPWFSNPIKPDWLVCRLTDRGRDLMNVTNVAAPDDVVPGHLINAVPPEVAANDAG